MLVLPKMRQDGARDLHYAEHVYVELLPDLFSWRGLEETVEAESRIVDESVDDSEAFDTCRDRSLNTLRFLDIELGYQHIRQST
jgi:hypothetical protein